MADEQRCPEPKAARRVSGRPQGDDGGSIWSETSLVSPIAWGMWRFAGATPRNAQALVETALDAEITLFDTADGFDGNGGFGDACRVPWTRAL